MIIVIMIAIIIEKNNDDNNNINGWICINTNGNNAHDHETP